MQSFVNFKTDFKNAVLKSASKYGTWFSVIVVASSRR